MSEIPAGLRYSKSHEWISNDAGTVTIGITDHAQELLGDIVFVELPEVGVEVEADGECGVVESVKAASDLYAPLGGEIVEVNEELMDSPEQVNDAPYDSWIMKIKLADEGDFDQLLDADGYAAVVEAE